jgi:hypothetical protein
VLGEERKIHKEYYPASGIESFESCPNSLLLPETLFTDKTPSPDKSKKNKKRWSPFVSSVGANDFDLDSIASDDSMREGEIFRVLGTKNVFAFSPMDTEKTRSRSTLGRAAVVSSSYDGAFPDLAQGEGGYAGRSRGANYASSNAKKKAAAAAAAASTSQMRPKVCQCRLVHLICVLTGVVVIALAVAFGALIAANHTEGGHEGAGASKNDFQAHTPSAPTPSKPLPTFSQAPTLTDSPSTKPTKMTNAKVPSNSPTYVVSETASPTGLRASQGPSASSLTVTQSPITVPVTATEQNQQSQSAPQSQSHRDPP